MKTFYEGKAMTVRERKNPPLHRFHIALPYAGVCALLAYITSVSNAPLAQESELEEVVITGSRITRSNGDASQPLSVIDSDSLTRVGQTDIGEIINDQPALLSSVTGNNSIDSAAQNVNQAQNVGGAALNLRGLGTARTLTLVNARRHVSGIEGSSAVDIGTIPAALIERVEVLTGGASAVYGADAVTGVVNFVLKDNFEGMEFDVQTGLSGDNDAQASVLSGLFGKNFNDQRGNIVIGVQYQDRKGLRQGDRSFLAGDGLWDNDTNPALRFQNGDISADATPNFSRYYNFANTGLYPVGLQVPGADTFIADYTAAFGSAPTLTAAERAIIDRAANAYPQAILPGRTFNVTGPYGIVALGDFGTGKTPLGSEPDLDGNGIPDCLDSFTGYNSSLGGKASFGAAGGCWAIDENGTLQPYRDGLVSDNFNQFGAPQSFIAPDRPFATPDETKWSINVNGRYAFNDAVEAFFESKAIYQEIDFGGDGHNFTDLLYGAPDNPFLPKALAPLAENEGAEAVGPGGLYISRDADDWGPNISTNQRTTYRFVGGLRGTLARLGLDYEASLNYGRFGRKLIDREDMVADRFFAAIDAATDPATGQAVCRSDLDPTAYPRTTPFNIFPFVGNGIKSSFFTFRPGDGQCKPANIWGGRGAVSQEAIDFFTYTRIVREKIEQAVLNAFFTGSTQAWFSLPAGAIDFVFGGEWREEKSARSFGDLDRGILPVSGVTSQGVAFAAGDFVGDVSAAGSLGATPSITLLSGAAKYDVWDVFAELSIPLLADRPLARELSVDAAWRRADYSTFGTNTTYKYGGVYAPLEDIRFRGSYSQAVRVPNLFELFSPDQGAFFRPADPCDATQIGLAANPQQRQANCIADLQANNVAKNTIFSADGSYAFEDPLSAGFPGVVGGNANLTPEEATTITYGLVLMPTLIDGLVISVDYWNIEIKDAITSISAQNIVNSCYDSATLANPFCALIARNDVGSSAQSGGLTFLRQTQLNFGAAQAAGWDLSLAYQFSISDFGFDVTAGATKQTELEFIEPAFGDGEPTVDNELEEMRRPQWSALAKLSISRGPLQLSWQTQYLSKQVLAFEDGAEIETVNRNFGPSGFSDPIAIHALNASFNLSQRLTLYGGIDNVTDERPFVTERAYPVGPRGRFIFLGVSARL